jgi:polysaccharide biosynthesis protein PslE
MTTNSKTNDYHLRELLLVFFRYKWVSLLTLAIVCCTGYYITQNAPRIYEARTRIYLDINQDRLQFTRLDTQGPRITQEQVISTEAELLQSWAVSELALENCFALTGTDTSKSDLAMLRGDIRVEQVKNSSMLELSFQHSSPEFAKEFVNNLVTAYLSLAAKRTQNSNDIDYYKSKLDESDFQLLEQERLLDEFKSDNSIVMLQKQIHGAINFKETLEKERFKLERKQTTLNTEFENLKSLQSQDDIIHMTMIIEEGDANINYLVDQYNKLSTEDYNNSLKYTVANPLVVSTKEKLHDVEKKILQSYDLVVNNKSSDLEICEHELELIKIEIAEQTAALLKLTKSENQFNSLEADLKSLRSVRATLFQKYQEVKLVSDSDGKIKAEHLSPARLPNIPVRPNVLFNLIITLIIAVVLGISLPFYLHMVGDKIINRFDAERGVLIPVLAVIRSTSE